MINIHYYKCGLEHSGSEVYTITRLQLLYHTVSQAVAMLIVQLRLSLKLAKICSEAKWFLYSIAFKYMVDVGDDCQIKYH